MGSLADDLELGLDTFGDRTRGADGELKSHAEVLRDVVAEGVLADQVGLAFLGVGEHHRADFAVSAPEVVLAAIAGKTSKLKLGTAVTVLSTDDPIRVFQRFSTLNAVSNGRAEVILGRGSFTESFPLFGFSTQQYNELFDEKLALFAMVREQAGVKFKGGLRPPVEVAAVYPPVEHGKLSTWIAVGGTPESCVRAAHYGFPLMLAIIGGDSSRFVPFADLYRRALKELGKAELPVGVHSPGYVAESDEAARDELWPHYQALVTKIGGERGWPPPTREGFDRECGVTGAQYVGSPETVAQKVAATVKRLGLTRFDMKYSQGALPHPQLLKSIELFGTRVAPRVRELLRG